MYIFCFIHEYKCAHVIQYHVNKPSGSAGAMFSKIEDVAIIDEFLGSTLVGKRYTPLFNYFVDEFKDRAFKVVADTYVTSESGSGIVHQAPGHGEVGDSGDTRVNVLRITCYIFVLLRLFIY